MRPLSYRGAPLIAFPTPPIPFLSPLPTQSFEYTDDDEPEADDTEMLTAWVPLTNAFREHSFTGHIIHLYPSPDWIFKQHKIVAWGPFSNSRFLHHLGLHSLVGLRRWLVIIHPMA